ncbi:MAG: 4Fe-4S dicluster domain-containing protein [Candidatus Heimdallarchaeota archaeon]|nr:4Fe-4S dicluster domain-containing protein [Candidatus Heimdallarchaeota archaeon]
MTVKIQEQTQVKAQERITYRIEIDAKNCNGCNNCTTACPVNAQMFLTHDLPQAPEERVIAIRNGVAVVINPFRCDGDGVCMIVCPKDAIRIEFEPLKEQDIFRKNLK